MTHHPNQEYMDSDHLSLNCQAGELGEEGGRKISVSDHVNGLRHSVNKSDSFVVDMERFSHLIEKDINSTSRITSLQRNLSRKGSNRTAEKKITSNERDTNTMLATSPRATLHGGSTPEKPAVVALGALDHSIAQVHHQITITNGNASTTAAAAESKCGGKRFSFRRSPATWTIDPRRILFFFATLSCMGTILLIYFTLSMGVQRG